MLQRTKSGPGHGVLCDTGTRQPLASDSLWHWTLVLQTLTFNDYLFAVVYIDSQLPE